MRLLMYGAGKIGRGFIGAVFASAGYEVVFVDIDTSIVDELNEKKQYTVQIIADPKYNVTVSGVRAVDGNDRDRVIDEIAGCDIMATAIGGNAVRHIAPIIAEGFNRRIIDSGRALDILICENLKDAPQVFAELIKSELPYDIHGVMEKKLGLVEAAIGRMIPVITSDEADADPLFIKAEEYEFLPVDRSAFRGSVPAMPQIIPYDPFSYYEERKLYLHNMSHCICANLGLKVGYKYIWQAIADARIRVIVKGAMEESCAMLSASHGVPYHVLMRHADDLIFRYTNEELADTCERVARDPERKIGADDRLAAPLRKCAELDIQAGNIAAGLAAVLSSMGLSEDRLGETLNNVCKLDGAVAKSVTRFYRLFVENAQLEVLIFAIDREKYLQRGKTI